MAFIEVRQGWDEATDTPVAIRARWVGREAERAQVDTLQLSRLGFKQLFHLGDVINLGALRLRVVSDYDYAIRGHEVMLDGWRARLRARLFPLWGAIDLNYRKTILVLAIFGFATRATGEYPNWGWVTRRWSRKQ